MCLGVPGRIEEIIQGDDPIFRTGKVSFGGILRDISLAGVSNAEVGDWVIVHAGFALNKLNEDEATEVFKYLRQISEYGKEELKSDHNTLQRNIIPDTGTS
ncbi:MAG: HypC/HybG/HupF family hydrogenase formation chaperone [Candidatus Aegiribacteria sp.]|nr:HypC/HybG/HupF family hydrogenase formation chaperone [Candidatus Aegiribacteria sp.]